MTSWFAFTLPSAIALVLFGYGVQYFEVSNASWLHGLKGVTVAVAVVAQAVWGMSRSLAPDRLRATIAILAAMAALAWQASKGSLVNPSFLPDAGCVHRMQANGICHRQPPSHQLYANKKVAE